MSTEDDRRQLAMLTAKPTTACERWAAAKIQELEAMVIANGVTIAEYTTVVHELQLKLADADRITAKAGAEIHYLRIKHAELRELAAERGRAIGELSTGIGEDYVAAHERALELAVQVLDHAGHKEAAARVQAMLDVAFV